MLGGLFRQSRCRRRRRPSPPGPKAKDGGGMRGHNNNRKFPFLLCPLFLADGREIGEKGGNEALAWSQRPKSGRSSRHNWDLPHSQTKSVGYTVVFFTTDQIVSCDIYLGRDLFLLCNCRFSTLSSRGCRSDCTSPKNELLFVVEPWLVLCHVKGFYEYQYYYVVPGWKSLFKHEPFKRQRAWELIFFKAKSRHVTGFTIRAEQESYLFNFIKFLYIRIGA